MGEKWALDAIARGYTVIAGETYDIVKDSAGCCSGCVWEDSKACPSKAVTVCCTGGNVLKRHEKGLKRGV